MFFNLLKYSLFETKQKLVKKKDTFNEFLKLVAKSCKL